MIVLFGINSDFMRTVVMCFLYCDRVPKINVQYHNISQYIESETPGLRYLSCRQSLGNTQPNSGFKHVKILKINNGEVGRCGAARCEAQNTSGSDLFLFYRSTLPTKYDVSNH